MHAIHCARGDIFCPARPYLVRVLRIRVQTPRHCDEIHQSFTDKPFSQFRIKPAYNGYGNRYMTLYARGQTYGCARPFAASVILIWNVLQWNGEFRVKEHLR